MGDMNWQNHCGIYTAPISVVENSRYLSLFGERLNGTYQACLILMTSLNLVLEFDMNTI